MARKSMAIIAFAVIAAGTLVWITISNAQQAEPLRQPVQRWEYAILGVTEKVEWETPKESHRFTNFRGLEKHLGLSEGGSMSRLFTRLGSDGWELCGHVLDRHPDGHLVKEEFIFKRLAN